MILQRLILRNFRQFEGENNRLDFTPIDNRHVTLIFASNGVGKTTILSAIDWCLYGGKEILYGDQKDVFLNKNIFKKLDENAQEKVEVVLSFEDRNHQYIIKRSMIVKKIENRQVNMQFNDPHVEIDGVIQHSGQKRIENVLSKAMRGYFFFKGEGVGKYADGANPKLVQKGIKNIMKIDFREEAKSLIEKVRKGFEKDSAILQEKQGEIDVPEARQAEIELEIEKLEAIVLKAEEDIESFDEMLKVNQEKLSKVKSTKELNDKANGYRLQIEKVQKEIETLQVELKSLITKSAHLAFSNEVFKTTDKILEQKRQKGELPIIGIGREFIENLLNEHKCICGETFEDGDNHHNELIKIMNNATAKSGIEASVSTLGVYISANMDKKNKFETDFKNTIHLITEKENDIKKLLARLEAIEEKIQEELPAEDNLMKKRNEIKSLRDKAIAGKARSEDKIESLKDEHKNIQKQIDTATVHNTEITLLRNRISYCKNAIEMLDTENKIEIENIRTQLTKKLEEKFSTILHSQKTAELDEDFKLNILENGNPTAKSDGEDKLISLIFISTLIDMAREKEQNKDANHLDPGAGIYPIVIDSPYGEFDSVYKKNISESVKNLSPQVIILLNQEHWNEGKTLGQIFQDSLAHQYALVAHRPKLDVLESETNVLRMSNLESYDLEIKDDREFTSIQKIEVKND